MSPIFRTAQGRIVDESGEDYLYHKRYFVFVELPRAITKKILSLQSAAA